MATQPDDDQNDDDILDLTNKLDDPDTQQGGDDADDKSGDDNQQGDDDKPTVTFEGEEPEPDSDNSVIRTMRQELRETKRKLAEAEKASAPKPVEIGPKPTLWDEDIAGDEDLYDQRMDEWRDRKASAERQTQSQAEQSRKANEEWQADLAEFQTKKAALQFDDADDVVETATLSLDLVQQAVIVKAAGDPALFLYALGKSEAKRAELAKIQDPIKLAAAVARMEGAVKVTRKAPAPDRAQRGSAAMPVTGAADKELERLEKEADRTNDRTKVIAYKSAQKAAAKDK